MSPLKENVESTVTVQELDTESHEGGPAKYRARLLSYQPTLTRHDAASGEA